MNLKDIQELSVKQITNPVIFDTLDHPTTGGLYDPCLGESRHAKTSGPSTPKTELARSLRLSSPPANLLFWWTSLDRVGDRVEDRGGRVEDLWGLLSRSLRLLL
jgi:hypothetical protein